MWSRSGVVAVIVVELPVGIAEYRAGGAEHVAQRGDDRVGAAE